MPFSFPFFGQRKSRAKVSTNGYLTFSGEHTKCGNDNHDCGRSYVLPNAAAPNDMIAVYWTDLDLTNGGSVHTFTIDPAEVGRNAGSRESTSCAYGVSAVCSGQACTQDENGISVVACCAASCGVCGGGGCDQRPGGVDACCTQHVTHDAPSCTETAGVGPCNMGEKAFVIEWADVPILVGDRQSITTHFEVILYESGAIKMVYKDVPFSSPDYAPPSAGIENSAGNEGISTSFNTPVTPNSAVMIGESCGSTQTVLSIAYCPGAWAPFGGGVTGVADPSGESHCTIEYADDFCYSTYGGQLSSLHTQYDYDQMLALTNGGDEHYMLGLHSDGAGNCECSCLELCCQSGLLASSRHCATQGRTPMAPLPIWSSCGPTPLTSWRASPRPTWWRCHPRARQA